MRRVALLSSTAVWRVLGAIRWYELWLVESVKSGELNPLPRMLRLANLPNPMFFKLYRDAGTGAITVECPPGLVSEKLTIHWPNAVSFGGPFDGMMVQGALPVANDA